MDEWQARSDAEILMRAEEIKNDPSRMEGARAVAEKQKAALETITESEPSRGKVVHEVVGDATVPRFS